MTDLLALAIVVLLWLGMACGPRPSIGRRRRQDVQPPAYVHRRAKPDWVREEIIRLKALGPDLGCRKLADIFNRRHVADGMSIGKTWVAETLRRHAYVILHTRRVIRRRKPGAGPINRVWGLDLTGVTDEAGTTHTVLGLLDHGSRRALTLKTLPDKASLTILKVLIDAVDKYGRPQSIRTDNEACFTSRLMRFSLWWFGIRHQTIELHCPWQNGRIERLFGTLKDRLRHWVVPDRQGLDASLAQFRVWYDAIRPHQHLAGRTPLEVWLGRAGPSRYTEPQWVEAWDGLLVGDYYPP